MDREDLIDAYLRTTYLAHLPSGDEAIYVGEPPPAGLVSLLDEHGAQEWAFITAANPGSELLCVEDNLAQNSALRAEFMRRGVPWFPGEGIGDDPSWPPEPSFLVIGLSPVEAGLLAREFGQLAIVTGTATTPAELLLCD